MRRIKTERQASIVARPAYGVIIAGGVVSADMSRFIAIVVACGHNITAPAGCLSARYIASTCFDLVAGFTKDAAP